MDALDSRAVRVPVRARLRAGARRGQSRRRSTTCSSSSTARFPARAADVAAVVAAAAPTPRSRICRPSIRDQVGRVTVEQDAAEDARVHREGRHRDRDRQLGDESRGVPASCRSRISSSRTARRCRARSSTFRARCSRRASTSSNPVANGMTEHTDVFFDDSPVFKLGADAAAQRRAARSRGSTARRRSAAAGRGARAYLENGVVAAEATRRQRQGAAVRTGDSSARAAARHVQVSVQRDLLFCDGREVSGQRTGTA